MVPRPSRQTSFGQSDSFHENRNLDAKNSQALRIMVWAPLGIPVNEYNTSGVCERSGNINIMVYEFFAIPLNEYNTFCVGERSGITNIVVFVIFVLGGR